MKNIQTSLAALGLLLILSSGCFAADNLDTNITKLQQRWAQVNYQMDGKKQLTAFEILINEAISVTQQFPSEAPAWIWSGIVKSSYAGAKGGLGALKFAKASKSDLEQALELDPKAMSGSAYTSLGVLYANVPGWPLGFGDSKKAETLLLKAIAINPKGIDSNYFYADYLLNEKRYQEAQKHLHQAQMAPKRANRPLADAGRQKEIRRALLKLNKHLSKPG